MKRALNNAFVEYIFTHFRLWRIFEILKWIKIRICLFTLGTVEMREFLAISCPLRIRVTRYYQYPSLILIWNLLYFIFLNPFIPSLVLVYLKPLSLLLKAAWATRIVASTLAAARRVKKWVCPVTYKVTHRIQGGNSQEHGLSNHIQDT